MKAFLRRVLILSALLVSMLTAAGAVHTTTITLDLNTLSADHVPLALPELGVFDPENPGYGAQLQDPIAVAVYNALLEDLNPGVSEVIVDLRSFELTSPEQFVNPMKAALAAFVFDHPESQYCIANQIQYRQETSGGKVHIISVSYLVTQEPNAQEMKDALDSVLHDFREQFDFTLPIMEQYRFIHDYVCNMAVYDYETASSGTLSAAHTAYGLLVNQDPVVCEGYSKAFKVLCDTVGLPCILVVGEATKDYNMDGYYDFLGQDNHMWNMVELDGQWYPIDTTWDDTDGYTLSDCPDMLISFTNYDYFLNPVPFAEESTLALQDHRASGWIYFPTDFPMEFALPRMSETAYPAAKLLSTPELNILFVGEQLNIPDVFWLYTIGSTILDEVPTLNLYLSWNVTVSDSFHIPAGKCYTLDSYHEKTIGMPVFPAASSPDSSAYTITRNEGFEGPLFSISGDLLMKNVTVEHDTGKPFATLSGGTFSAPGFDPNQFLYDLHMPAGYSPIKRFQATYDNTGRMRTLSDLGDLPPDGQYTHADLFPGHTDPQFRNFLLFSDTLAPFVPTYGEIMLSNL